MVAGQWSQVTNIGVYDALYFYRKIILFIKSEKLFEKHNCAFNMVPSVQNDHSNTKIQPIREDFRYA